MLLVSAKSQLNIMPNPKTEDIVKALQAQKTVKDIVEELGVPCRTVYRIKDRLKTRGTTKRKTGSGRPLSVVTSGFIEKIKQKVKRNPVLTMRGMARELGVNEKSVRKAVKLLGARSLARTKRFLLTESLKASRLARAKKILSMLKKKSPVILFTDEKYFTVNPVSNSRHDRLVSDLHVSDIPAKVRFSPQMKHPRQVMMFGLVSSDGKKMSPVFLDSGLRLDSKLYIDRVLVSHVLPWIQKNYPDPREYIFMQDGAPCHTSKITQKWLEEHLNFWPKEVWPPSSPDLNPLDFSIWAKVQAQSCKQQHPNLGKLKSSVFRAWAGLDPDFIIHTCHQFCSRIEKVRAAEGGYIDVK